MVSSTESSIEFWYQSEWLIAFTASAVTVLLAFVVQGITNYIKQGKLRKEMAKHLSIEILTNAHNNFRYLKSIQEIRSAFEAVTILDTGEFSSYPNFVATGKEATTGFFDYYRNQLSLFDARLMVDTYSFYEHHLSSVKAGAKKLQTAFEKFYSRNPMVGRNDVLKSLNEHISNIEVLRRSGEELSAKFTFFDKTLRGISREKKPLIKEAMKITRNYIRNLTPGETFKMEDLMSITEAEGKKVHNIILMIEVLRAIDKNSLKRLRPGEYKKILKDEGQDVPAF